MQNTIKYKALILLTAAVAFSGCRKIFDLPNEKDYLSTQADYTTKAFEVRLGRTNLINNVFNPVGSAFPMTFTVVNPRFGDGRDASDMLAKKPTLVWTAEYTGKETSLAAIEAKRKLEDHSILELRPSGDIIFWYTANKSFMNFTDTIAYPQDLRYFDVKIANSGGSRVIKGLSLNVKVDVPYEPNDDYNQTTGLDNTTRPGGNIKVLNYATVSGIRGESTNVYMTDTKNAATGIVTVKIQKFQDKPGDFPTPNPAAVGHRLRFRFVDKNGKNINPNSFNATNWLEQIHGFTPDGSKPGVTFGGPQPISQTTPPEWVEYNVAYPIPVAKIPTKYTAGGVLNSAGGDKAHAEFTFTRLGFGGVRETGKILQDFRIYEKGDWEIVYTFSTVNPKFVND